MKRTHNGNHSQGNNSNWCPPNNPQHLHGYGGNAVRLPPLALTHHSQSFTGQHSQMQYQGFPTGTQDVTGQPSQPQCQGHSMGTQNVTGQPSQPQYQAHSMGTQNVTGQPSQPQYQAHSMGTQNVTGQPSQPQYQGHSMGTQNVTGQPSQQQYQAHSMGTQNVIRQPSQPQYQAHSMGTQNVTGQPSQPQYQAHSMGTQNVIGQPSQQQCQGHSMGTQNVKGQPSQPQCQAHSMGTQNVKGQPSQPQYQAHFMGTQNVTGQPSQPQCQGHSMGTQNVIGQPSQQQYQAHSMGTQNVTGQPSQPQYQGHSMGTQNATGQPSQPQYQAHSMGTQNVIGQPSQQQYQAHSMGTQNVTGQPSQQQYQAHSMGTQNVIGQFVKRHQQDHLTGLPNYSAHMQCKGNYSWMQSSQAQHSTLSQHPHVQSGTAVQVVPPCQYAARQHPQTVQSHVHQQQPSVKTQSQGQQQTMSTEGNQLLTQQVPSQRQYASVVVTTSSSNSASQNQISSCGTGAYLSSSMFPSPGHQGLTSTTGPVDLSGGSASLHNQHSTNPATLATSASQSQLAPGSSKSHQVPGPSLGPIKNHIQTSQDFWLQRIKEWYPDRDKKTYFLPPRFFRRTHHKVETMAGLSVLVPGQPPNIPKQGPAPFYPSLTSQTQSSQFLLSPAQPSIHLPTSSQSNQIQSNQIQSNQIQSNQIQSNQIQSNQIQPTPPVAGSVFTLPQGDPAPLPHYIETDVLDDDAAERLLRCLRVLSKEHREVMMVISQLEFRKYLDNDTDPISTAACANLPRPVTMQQQQHHDGDFDVLIIHRHYGLIVCEVKAVGADRKNTPDLNKAVVGKVIKALKQLNKAKTVLNHLMSDMGPVQVTKTLVLPNVTSAELMQALSTAPKLKQDLCTCLDANNIPEAISRCLCADQIPTNADLESLCNQGDSPGETNQSTSSSQTSVSPTFPLLSSWWKNMTSQGAGPDPQMSDTVYDKLLARFCGPATTVEVPTVTAPRKAMAKPGKYTPARKVLRTEGEAVAETGLIHSLLALYPDQVDLLSDNTLCCVHLRGPPGTGKTIVLVLKAIQWLHQGHDVHVVSVVNESRAVSLLIERQLQCVLDSNPASGFGTVHRHVVHDYPYTVNKLAALASDGELYVIADEVLGKSSIYRERMDISVGPQEFQRKTTETLSGLEGFDEIMDDVTRRTKNTSPLEIMKSGFELNREKYQFMK
ncbi:mediator of RNA polymerase II transcription subunit 12-like [Littorina saxatilis]|uniref:mediator of RNA polymerase II transcription subunit 12-like n=1 Tax=Littorina saxatilis TaxID=31220 RepID=UPI0038B476B9